MITKHLIQLHYSGLAHFSCAQPRLQNWHWWCSRWSCGASGRHSTIRCRTIRCPCASDFKTTATTNLYWRWWGVLLWRLTWTTSACRIHCFSASSCPDSRAWPKYLPNSWRKSFCSLDRCKSYSARLTTDIIDSKCFDWEANISISYLKVFFFVPAGQFFQSSDGRIFTTAVVGQNQIQQQQQVSLFDQVG